jgi:hypothetical protein
MKRLPKVATEMATPRAHLQSHPGDEHHGHPAADGRNPSQSRKRQLASQPRPLQAFAQSVLTRPRTLHGRFKTAFSRGCYQHQKSPIAGFPGNPWSALRYGQKVGEQRPSPYSWYSIRQIENASQRLPLDILVLR